MEKLSKTTQSEPMKIEDMNEGVRIILDRMRTNPEEFEEGSGHMRWMRVIQDVISRVEKQSDKLPWLYDAEVHAIYDGMRSIQRDKFTGYVLRALADANHVEDDGQLDLPYMPAMPRQTFGLSVEEFKTASRLGVSPKTFAQAKQAEIDKLRQAYNATKGIE